MNENVLAARRGLNEPITLGRVEPLDRTFSHPSSPRDQDNKNEQPVPANRDVRGMRIRRLRRQTTEDFPGSVPYRDAFVLFAAFRATRRDGIAASLGGVGLNTKSQRYGAGDFRTPTPRRRRARRPARTTSSSPRRR